MPAALAAVLAAMRARAWLLPALLATHAAATAATMPPVRMQFVDANTGAPVAGAAVVFHATARQGTITGHGGRRATLFLAEAVTDAQGEVRFPAQEFGTQPFLLNTNYENPGMMVLRSGYRLEVLHNQRYIVPQSAKEISNWEYDGQTRKLQPWHGEADAPQVLSSVDLLLKALLAAPCDWQKIPRFLAATERMANDWERIRAASSDPSVRSKGRLVTPLSNILRNDAYFQQQGCSSPRAFFAPYLR